jgi:5-methylcytosine-specific restriction endonuclease McrA
VTRYSHEYRQVLDSERWEVVRAAALRRADYRCARCGRRAREAGCPLDVHHASGYARLGDERPAELRVLCRYPCHEQAHGRPGYGRFGWQRLALRWSRMVKGGRG